MSDIAIGNQQERLLSVGYIAGFFDGEGSISLIHAKAVRGNQLRPEVSICQKDRGVLELIAQTLRANGVGCHMSTSRARGVHRIMISGMKRTKSFIEYVRNEVALKGAELDEVYGFIQRRLSVPPNTPYTPQDYAIRERLIAIRADR